MYIFTERVYDKWANILILIVEEGVHVHLPSMRMTNITVTQLVMKTGLNLAFMSHVLNILHIWITFYDVCLSNLLFVCSESYFSYMRLKNIQVPMLDSDRQTIISGDTMSHPSFGYHIDWYL